MNWHAGCEPKTSREPVVVIDEHVVKMTAGVPYTPPRDGFWLSNEVFTRLLEKLNELQNRLDAMPQTNLRWEDQDYCNESVYNGSRSNVDNNLPLSVQWPESGKVYTPQGGVEQDSESLTYGAEIRK